MFRASPFRLLMYEQCPQQYKFVYLDHLAEQYSQPKPYLTMGAHVHNALHDFFSKIPVEQRTWETLETILRKRWRENRKGFEDRVQEQKWGMKALQMLKLFVLKNDLVTQPVLLEDYYDMQLTPDIKILGRIDRVDALDDGLHVIDYKTGQFKAEDVSDIQLAVYAMIVEHRLRKPVHQASYLYLAENRWYTIPISSDMYEMIQDDIMERVETILADQEFNPKINKHCRSCDYLTICPKADMIRQLIERDQLK